MTIPRNVSERLIFVASFFLTPVAPVFEIRSEPLKQYIYNHLYKYTITEYISHHNLYKLTAKSTKCSFPILT